uniref:Transmembrane protein 254 n=1 Tax=Terrapene triunguis TaxID=2587831 RepID=A0A674IH90_9SAUR
MCVVTKSYTWPISKLHEKSVGGLSFIETTWAVFLPSTIPYENLGPFGHFTKYLVDNHPKLFWLAWGIHIAEALYSIKLCKTKGITDSSVQRRWFIQTFLFGIASLSHLLAYKPPPKKQR